MKKKPRFSKTEIELAEQQIKEMQRQIDYDTKDYTIEFIVKKFEDEQFVIPEYQRQFIWPEKNRALFVESVLLGLPIPFMFFVNCESGKMEIIDGAQRVQTLHKFVNNQLKLTNLKKLTNLNKFKFNDLPEARQLKFLDRTLRVIALEEDTPNEVRQDLFNRINTTGLKANDSEVRRGSYPGKLTDFIEQCTKNEMFINLCPLSQTQEIRYERFEFILRFFAYLNNYLNFDHSVNTFLDEYLINNLSSFDEEVFKNEFEAMLSFVEKYFPNGFAKTPTSKSTPRVRFEAIAIGVGLALRKNPQLTVTNVNWLESDEFKVHTTSDASNNQGKLASRVEYVREQLLKG